MDKIKRFFIRVASGIVLFIVYIFIEFIAASICGYDIYDISENRIDLIICVCIAGIITPILYSLSMKFFGVGYEKVLDYIPSAVLFFAICFGMCEMNPYSGFVLFICAYLLVMYMAANGIYLLIHDWKESKYGLLNINWGLEAVIIIFLIIDFIFWYFVGSDAGWGLCFAIVFTCGFTVIVFFPFVFVRLERSKIRAKDDEGYRQTKEDLLSDREEEKDITGEDEPANGSEPYINYNMQKAVLENMKSFLLDSGNDFLLIDEEYHLQTEKDVYYPDLLLYHMKLQCLAALNLKTDDFKPEYLDRMNAYLETLDRDFKKADDNPSMGIFLCKNEDTEVVEYCLNKSLSQEMAAEYEAKLIDIKILKEKLGELYDRARETNPLFNA